MIARPATTHDSDFLLELKNDPVMRQFSVVTHKEIKKQAHNKWLEEHLDEIQIIFDDENRIGMLRVTKDREISINLRPDFRGKGYGTRILKEFCPINVWAKIVNGNVASMKIFLKNGFEITDYENNYYVLQN